MLDGIEEALGITALEEVGEGAFKTVYRAVFMDGQIRALKILKRAPTERDRRELDSMRMCEHPSIVRIIGSGNVSTQGKSTIHYVVEEFIEGGSLRDRLNSGNSLSPEEGKELLRQMSPVLEHMRMNHVVHRDIKPANLMIRENTGQFVLTDFGIARLLIEASLTQDFMPSGPGTAYYASPEQLENNKPLIDWRSDQFNLAVCVHESVYGSHPYGSGADIAQSVKNVAARRGPDPDKMSRARNDGLAVIERMLMPWPFGRYIKYEELIAELTP